MTIERRPPLCRAQEITAVPPLQAVRAHCISCCNGKASEVAACVSTHCPLWLLRLGHRPTPEEVEQHADVTLHPSSTTVGELYASGAVLKAIRGRCLDCSGGSAGEVKSCVFDTCALHPFRMGKNPNIRLSPEQKAELLARLKR